LQNRSLKIPTTATAAALVLATSGYETPMGVNLRSAIVNRSFQVFNSRCGCVCLCHATWNTKGGIITVPLTSCLTGLDQSVLKIKTKIVSCHTDEYKDTVQQGILKGEESLYR
jgi:hypothetical protein